MEKVNLQNAVDTTVTESGNKSWINLQQKFVLSVLIDFIV